MCTYAMDGSLYRLQSSWRSDVLEPRAVTCALPHSGAGVVAALPKFSIAPRPPAVGMHLARHKQQPADEGSHDLVTNTVPATRTPDGEDENGIYEPPTVKMCSGSLEIAEFALN